jgi:hypothetical protein
MADQLQLKLKLYEAFKTSDIENTLKATLRAQLVQLFRTQYGVVETHATSLLQTLVNYLIAEYFERSGYQYSLSVFLPESGHNPSNVLPLQDILQALRIENNSKLFKTLISNKNNNSALLSRILEEVSRIHTNNFDKDTQTETLETLDTKLRSIDEQTVLQQKVLFPQRTVEDRLIKITKEIEDRTRKEMMEEVFGFKKIIK